MSVIKINLPAEMYPHEPELRVEYEIIPGERPGLQAPGSRPQINLIGLEIEGGIEKPEGFRDWLVDESGIYELIAEVEEEKEQAQREKRTDVEILHRKERGPGPDKVGTLDRFRVHRFLRKAQAGDPLTKFMWGEQQKLTPEQLQLVNEQLQMYYNMYAEEQLAKGKQPEGFDEWMEMLAPIASKRMASRVMAQVQLDRESAPEQVREALYLPLSQYFAGNGFQMGVAAFEYVPAEMEAADIMRIEMAPAQHEVIITELINQNPTVFGGWTEPELYDAMQTAVPLPFDLPPVQHTTPDSGEYRIFGTIAIVQMGDLQPSGGVSVLVEQLNEDSVEASGL